MRTVYEFPTCELTITGTPGDQNFDLQGDMAAVNLIDRERIASLVGKAIDLEHEAAYLLLWNAWNPR